VAATSPPPAILFSPQHLALQVNDPKLKEKKTLKDVRGNIAAVKELLEGTCGKPCGKPGQICFSLMSFK
jgi:hypothetical protein